MAGTERQVVKGRVREVPGGTEVEIGPVALGADGRAEAVVEFDRPLEIPLSALFPDPDARKSLLAGIEAILECESPRIDEIAAAGGLDPARDFAGTRMRGADFVGSAERPMDMRGWDLSGCDLTGCRFEHVLVDAGTRLDGATLDGVHGPDAPALLALAEAPGPRP